MQLFGFFLACCPPPQQTNLSQDGHLLLLLLLFCFCSQPDNLPDPAEVAEERGESGRLGVVTVGFGHDAVLGVAGAVVDAVKTGEWWTGQVFSIWALIVGVLGFGDQLVSHHPGRRGLEMIMLCIAGVLHACTASVVCCRQAGAHLCDWWV